MARVPACLAGSQGFDSPTGRQCQHHAAVVQPVERRVESPSVGASIPSCGASCWMRAREDQGNRLLSGGRHTPARAFESLRIRQSFTSLAQLDQSAGLRNRRSHVRIVHEVPTNEPCSTTAWPPACGCRTQVPGRLRSDKARRGDTPKARDPARPRARCRKAPGRSSKLTGPPPAAHRLPKGRCYPGRERKAKNVSSPA